MRNKKAARIAPGTKARATAHQPQGGHLIAVELGAGWPDLAERAADVALRVLSQDEGESPGAFAERAAASIDELLGRGVTLGSLIVACNERADDAAQEARRKLAGLALGAMAKAQTGRVCFNATAHSCGKVRHALSTLARALHEEWHGAGLEVTVDFNERATSPSTRVFTFTARVA